MTTQASDAPRAGYRRQTAAETLALIVRGRDPWLALGQFLDD